MGFIDTLISWVFKIIVFGVVVIILYYAGIIVATCVTKIQNLRNDKKIKEETKSKLDEARSHFNQEDIKENKYIVESALNNRPGHKFWEILPIKSNVCRVNIDLTGCNHRFSIGSSNNVINGWHRDFDRKNYELMDSMYKIAALNKEPSIFRLYFYDAGVHKFNGYILIDHGLAVYNSFVTTEELESYTNINPYTGERVSEHLKEMVLYVKDSMPYAHRWSIDLYNKYAKDIDFDNVYTGDQDIVSLLKSNNVALGDMRGWTTNLKDEEYYTDTIKFSTWALNVFNEHNKEFVQRYCKDQTYLMTGMHHLSDYKLVQQAGNDVRLLKEDGTEIVLKNAEKNADQGIYTGNTSMFFTITPKVAI